ncbi:hypothetical protein AIOL_003021 [Candidatus Rhodobacter oscarellae]|uniref:Lipid/polyisoprenoid-binding YceI-like domain-containing protein n=1 Tax=Candidatus Rhodobacter oscarellae TaxID=1675527 RepID=A0A0J9E5V8_9RHOB|nr:hypothetical protein AIOL_003021 [Candidatus Rhodobacter lobularis]
MAAVLALLGAAAALAAPQSYRLEPDASTVQFTYQLNGQPMTGRMPVTRADIEIDFANLRNSTAQVTLNAAKARAGLIFATEAMRGARVLDTKRHPEMRFVSTAVRGTPSAAQLAGQLTIRGVTRPVTLQARLYRQRGTAPGALDRLSILLTGSVDRTAFGASGFADLVGPRIDITILARIARE